MIVNKEIRTAEERDTLIKELQNMEFKREPPKSWQDLFMINGWYISNHSGIIMLKTETKKANKNLHATEQQAKSSLAYAQLTQLMKDANGDSPCKVAIAINIEGQISSFHSDTIAYKNSFIKLKDGDTAWHFFEYHRDLLNDYFQIK